MVQEKKIIDEVSGWLRVFNDGSVDRTWLGPPEAKFMVEPVPAHDEFIDGVATRDVLINPDSGLRVRVYLPERIQSGPDSNKKKLPVFLHLQGGGFCISQPDWYLYYVAYARLARTAQAMLVSPYLRRAPEHRLPAAIEDSHSALLWLSSLARADSTVHDHWLQANADFSRIFIIGDSSGGNLVHHVAARLGNPSDISPARIAGLIPIHPGFCRAERSHSELEMPQTPFLTLDMVDKFLKLGLPEGTTKDHPVTCPMGPAAPPLEEVELPPMMLCLAEKDLFIDTEMEYYEAMKKAGKKVEVFVSKGMTHSFYLNSVAVEMDPTTKAETEKLFAGIVGFVNKN